MDMRAALAIALLAASPLCWGAAASAAWSDLWRTPDQQGQALLDTGRAAQAADRFHDPRRRAYADLQAGRYEDAAKLLAPFSDAESEYNRGNALAKTGRLQAALESYDAALRQSPNDKDIRHNRDLVARALEQQRQSSQASRNGSHSLHQGGSSSASSGQQQQSAGGQRNGSGSQPSAAGGQQSAGSDRMAVNGSRSGTSGADNPNSQAPGQSGANNPQQDRGQAQRDAAAAAALARQQQRGKSGDTGQSPGGTATGTARSSSKEGDKSTDGRSLLAGGARTPPQKAESERQLALDQWLRQIPDSPAGLLQRKFLIEHMMKEQDNGEAPQEDGP
jgi:Ca-activated chloride channel homolog